MRSLLYTILLGVLCTGMAFAAPTINIVSDNASTYPNSAVPRYCKFEVTFTIGNIGTHLTDYNAFNPNIAALSSDYWNKKGILVDALLTKPGQSSPSITYPCFYYENFDGSKGWKLRFSPTEVGTWKYKIRAKHSSGETITSERTFNCTTSSKHGFIRVNPNDTRFFQFSDGTPFHPIGTAVTGYSTDWDDIHETVFSELKANGGNFARVWTASSRQIEYYWVNQGSPKPQALNRYVQSRCEDIDYVVDLAEENDIYIQFLIDDWTRFKNNESPYINEGESTPAPCESYEEVFDGENGTHEIYQRKLRYIAARWGYSVHVLAWEFINEYYGGDWDGVRDWHDLMCDTLKAKVRPDYLPSGYNMDLWAQPHLTTSSNGNQRLRANAGIDWSHPQLDIINFHWYNQYSNTWTSLEARNEDGDYFKFEQLGCDNDYPWIDTAVLVDRLARVQMKRIGWIKPNIWGEYGLGYQSGDWHDAYYKDSLGRNTKDALWVGILTSQYINQWKAAWMVGGWPEDDAPRKFWFFKPLANYVRGEDFTGLKQETAYPVSDPLNPSPTLTCSNSKIMAVALIGKDKAYLYVKNLTDVWFRVVDSSQCPSPSNQSGTVKLLGMEPGTYTLERWRTDIADSNQKTTSTITVGSDGVASINVSLGTTMGTYDYAYKIYKDGPSSPAEISVSISADKKQVKPGDIITYSVSYNNAGNGVATNIKITVPIPANTTYISSSHNGSLVGNQVEWNFNDIDAGETDTLTFQVRVN